MAVVTVAMSLVLIPGHSVASASTTPYTATGYFQVAQKPGGGWTLVTPQGEPFYASGIDTVAPDGSGTDQVTGVCPYCVTVANDFPNTGCLGDVDGRAAPLVGLQHHRCVLRQR